MTDLSIRFCNWLSGCIVNQAHKGEKTACAAGFDEWALDCGPFTFLFNSDGYGHDVELQVLGWPVFHSASYDGFDSYDLLGLRWDSGMQKFSIGRLSVQDNSVPF